MKMFLLFMIAAFCSRVQSATNDSMAQFLTSQQLVQSGKEIFQQNCVGCHGVDATGQGPASQMLDPKPRNLVSGAFKFRSTPLGSLPTNQDLIRTLEQGVLGTSMPGFPLLSSQEKYALVAFIKSLRSDWEKNVGKSFAIPQAPREVFSNKTLLLASAYRGRKIFEEGCMTCHGDKGQGDGPSAEGLVDNDNNPIRPANLSKRQIKSGRRAEDVYKAILTGLDGTPMPSFDGIYTESQIWDLVAYVFFLRGQGAGIYEPDFILTDALLKEESRFKNPSKNLKNAPATIGCDSWN
jgi:mono/diheme cytochrome c family protein